ncbi:MAG: RNA-guided endonuclease InsQ/TnpB family protein [Mycobacterium sp.]
MSRFRLLPTPAQQVVLLEHCQHARFVWNLAVEQQQFWQPGRRAPGYSKQSAQLTEIRAEYDWLAAGSQTVQQQALRDFAQAMRNFFAGTHRRQRTRLAIARLKAREADRRRDWVEKTTTDLARRFDTIRVEDLDVRAMTRSAHGTLDQPGVRVAQKRGLNRAISRQGWGRLVARLDHKVAGRIERVPAAYTSQRCSACGHVAPENRKSQAAFVCVACQAGPYNADVNAARNIAAGRAVPAQRDLAVGRSVNCEPQLCSPVA